MRELHLHLDGSLRPSTVLDLYHEQNIIPPCDDVLTMKKMLTADPNSKILADVLRVFNIPLKVLQRKEALKRASKELVEDLASQGNEYAEIRFAPQLSTREGLSQKEVLDAVIEGVKEGLKTSPSINIGLLLCLMRGGTKEENKESVLLANEYKGNFVKGLDLAGDENNYPCALYEDEFALAKSLSIPFTIHAGESLDLDNVKNAIKFGAKRLGHGVSLLQDKELMHIVKEEGILVECCLTSNIQTREVTDLRKHPLRDFFDYGIRVNINSDNLTVSDTNIKKEYDLARKYLSFTEDELSLIDKYAIDASF